AARRDLVPRDPDGNLRETEGAKIEKTAVGAPLDRRLVARERDFPTARLLEPAEGDFAGARSVGERVAPGRDRDREIRETRRNTELADPLRRDDRDLAAVRALPDRREQPGLRARQERRAHEARAAEIDGDRLAGAGRHERVARRRPDAPHQRPSAVLRERAGSP